MGLITGRTPEPLGLGTIIRIPGRLWLGNFLGDFTFESNLVVPDEDLVFKGKGTRVTIIPGNPI
jgi:hypothetical protein